VTTADRDWMTLALVLARKCAASYAAFSVGAVIVDREGQLIAEGYSRETDDNIHAEEAALTKVAASDPRLAGATLYSTLEPCSERKSRSATCTELTLRTGITRVVIAWREPDLFVSKQHGVEKLRSAGLVVDDLSEFADEAKAINAHLFEPVA
jgi:diaminohydroxyphosphoribosylaminopyrimidine deaminase/5-amino-6-(5-phosphoribosylamino)uracil reductase